MPPHFLDTNVLLRYLSDDDQEKARRALSLLLRAERGEETLVTSPLVVFETVYTLQRTYRLTRSRIRDLVAAVVSLRGLQLPGKHTYLRALDLYVDHNISFADAYNVAYMKARGITGIYTWDADFDRIKGIRRIEPADDHGLEQPHHLDNHHTDEKSSGGSGGAP